MRNWQEITGGDIQILFAHLLVMGVMKRGMQQNIGLIVRLRNWISLENICPGIHTKC